MSDEKTTEFHQTVQVGPKGLRLDVAGSDTSFSGLFVWGLKTLGGFKNLDYALRFQAAEQQKKLRSLKPGEQLVVSGHIETPTRHPAVAVIDKVGGEEEE